MTRCRNINVGGWHVSQFLKQALDWKNQKDNTLVCVPQCGKSKKLLSHKKFVVIVTHTQCGNFRIFLPLRFYVKSKLANVEPQKLPF